MGATNKICPSCGKKMKQQFIGLQHCKCGISWKKDIGFFERTTDMIFCLERRTVRGRVKQCPVIRYDDKKECKPVGDSCKKLVSGDVMNEYQDSEFYFIAGYTSGGAPYGITWKQAIADGMIKDEQGAE